MKTRTLMLLPFLLLILSCGSNSGHAEKEKESYEQTRTVLLKKEKENAGMFLSVTGNSRKNIVGQTVVRGKISSKANIASYKDVTIQLDFYSQTKALLESDKETIFVEVGPGHSVNFKTKYFAPKGTDSVALSVIGAKALD